MSSLVEAIAKQAQLTFSKTINDEGFSDCLARLIRSVSRIRATDLGLSHDAGRTVSSDSDSDSDAEASAPVTYIEVEENNTFSMGIFLLKSGARIPLHDHPDMHGVLKVIQGTVKVTSYSPLSNAPGDNTIPQDINNRIKSTQRDSLFPVEKHLSANVSDKDEPCVLRPKEGNIHEICAVGGTAAFFDILAPPYDLIERDCNYYTVLEAKKPDAKIKTWLLRCSEPTDFWAESAPYTGPKISL